VASIHHFHREGKAKPCVRTWKTDLPSRKGRPVQLTVLLFKPMMPHMEKKNRLYLVRHGQVEGFDRTPIYGHTDVKMTEIGRIQMESVGERLRLVPIHAAFASDLHRSRTGAGLIARHHDVEVKILEGLREMFFGDWEALGLADVRKNFSEELEKRQKNLMGYAPPGGGESLRDFSERVLKTLRRVFADRPGQDILMVAHGGVNRVILCDALGLDVSRMFGLHQDYGCLNVIDYFPDMALVRLVNG